MATWGSDVILWTTNAMVIFYLFHFWKRFELATLMDSGIVNGR